MFKKELENFDYINQLTIDPQSLDSRSNCGPTSTAMIAGWITGHKYDPENVRKMAGDTVGQGTYTGYEVDTYFWNNVVKCPTQLHYTDNVINMRRTVKSALSANHALKALMWFSSPGQYGHFRVCIGINLTAGGYTYKFADPWTGGTWVQDEATTFNLSQNYWLEVMDSPKSHKHGFSEGKFDIISRLDAAYSLLHSKPYPHNKEAHGHLNHAMQEINKAKKIISRG